MKNNKFVIIVLIIVIVVSSVYLIIQFYGNETAEFKVPSSLEEITENTFNKDENKENKIDPILTKSEVVNVTDTSTNDEPLLKEVFIEKDRPYPFGVIVNDESISDSTAVYDLQLIDRYTPTNIKVNKTIRATSEDGKLAVGDQYRLFIKFDSKTNGYIVTEIISVMIHEYE